MPPTVSVNEKLDAVIASARSILEKQTFAETARAIFDQCCRMTGATAGYVALLSDDEGLWTRVEEYLGTHTNAQPTHGLCPNCIRELYPEDADEVLDEPS